MTLVLGGGGCGGGGGWVRSCSSALELAPSAGAAPLLLRAPGARQAALGRCSSAGASCPSCGSRGGTSFSCGAGASQIAGALGASALGAALFAAASFRRRGGRRRAARPSASTEVLRRVGDGWDEEQLDQAKVQRMSNRAPLLIDGEIYTTEKTVRVLNPANGMLVGLAPQASKKQLEDAVNAAHSAGNAWAAMSTAERAAKLSACANVLRLHTEALATLQTNESGRPIAETRIELFVAAATFESAARKLDLNHEEVISEDDEKKVVIRHSPIGVVAIIAPWNAPIILGWKPTACALACGNTVVLKPAPQTPLTTLRIGEMLRTILPSGVLNIVVGSDDNSPRPGEVLTGHPLVRKVVFTGSASVGTKVMTACAKDFKRILLELGGNDAAIVREDVDIEKAVEGVFRGAFFNNGQTCCAIKRLFVHKNIFDEFVNALTARARRAKIGNGLNAGVELGPLANNEQLRHVSELVADARADGGRVLCGGGAVAGPPGDEGSNTGLFYLPTIVVGIEEGSRLVDEEQFGPVVPVMPFEDDAEALRRANSTVFGLGGSVWSRDVARANEMANQLRAGTVWVNRHCEFIRNAPFGGFGSSGIGRAGDLAMRDMNEYTETRTLVLGRLPKKVLAGPPPTEEVDLKRAADALRKKLALIPEKLWSEADAFEEQAKEVLRVFPFRPLGLKKALDSFMDSAGISSFVLRGLPTHLSEVNANNSPDGDVASKALLVGVAAMLEARAFAYTGHCEEALVHKLSLDADELYGRSGRFCPSFDAPRRYCRPEERVPEIVAAFCVRVAGEPVTFTTVDYRALAQAADKEDLECLRRTPLSFFDTETGQRTEPVHVVTDMVTDTEELPFPIVDLRRDRFEPEGSQVAIDAYLRVRKVSGQVCEGFELRAGDLVVFQNKRCLHSWGPRAIDGDTCIQVLHASKIAMTWDTRVVK